MRNFYPSLHPSQWLEVRLGDEAHVRLAESGKEFRDAIRNERDVDVELSGAKWHGDAGPVLFV
jgi:hypothetical protein